MTNINLPTQHLSVRVPWHDAEWNGKVCCNPRENGSCMFLQRINGGKKVEQEENWAGKWFHELPLAQMPPCVEEKVHFMSPHAIYKKVEHPYSKNEGNNAFYAHYRETTYCYPAYSFSVIPYNWMLKNPNNNVSKKSELFPIPYDAQREPALNFSNSWVQQIDNQRAVLNTFIQPIVPGHSLVFIYAKNIPLVDTTERILIGVGHINKIGDLKEYEYEEKNHSKFRSGLWERPVYHTIREGFENGFLLPYHEFFKFAAKDDSIHIPDYIAFAPTFEEFSFGSEWVSNDSAIASLLILHAKLKKFENLLPNKNYEKPLKWIDNQLSRLWKMRGAFPGLGAVLSGLNVDNGNWIAWQLDKIIRDKEDEVVQNPWYYVNLLFNGDTSFLSKNLKVTVSNTVKATWKVHSDTEKLFFQLLSRMNVNNEQVKLVIDSKEKEMLEYLKNPYLLYEKSRLKTVVFAIDTIDKAIFADVPLLKRFPLPTLTDIDAPLDQRRVRAVCVHLMELNAIDGHTLLTDNQLITKLTEQPLQPLCNPSLKNIKAIQSFLEQEVVQYDLDKSEETYYFKLKRLDSVKDKIKKFIEKRAKRNIHPLIQIDWMTVINNKFQVIDPQNPLWFQEKDKQARIEKANALNILANSKVSVLIGPAGTGKTTLLDIFCEQPFIRNGTILKLAPTGKARVKMGKDAKTLAQFLIRTKRYDPQTGLYAPNPNGKQERYDTVIVDEASMLTEEQLAALLDSLDGVERFILVGDYRQLPPIGAGRPFVDIMEYLKKINKGVAALKVLFRQSSQNKFDDIEKMRLDVRLSKWFSDDDIKKQEVDIFKEIAVQSNKDWGNIKFVEWQNAKQLEEIMIRVVNEEVENLVRDTDGKVIRNPQANFDASLGANHYIESANWSGFGIESAHDIESWQILSPTRTAGFGTKVLNQRIQNEFRGKTKEKAIFPGTYTDWKSKEQRFAPRKMPKPVGTDGLVYGDKIINIRNVKRDKLFNPNEIDNENIFKYIANGEIGLHVGQYGSVTGERFVNIAFSSQKGYAYSFKESDFKEDGEVQMELAYAITVHKSQGSGFKVVLFVLPNPCSILSRELFYTALTRQEDRIIILHQGAFNDFRKYTSGEYSETGRRLTDLFSEPTLKWVNQKFYDAKYIQVSAKGEFMISKSEVIIADQLYFHHINYVYEAPLSDEKGVTIHPDFTIEDKNSGIIYYWEHLGLLTQDDYRSKWQVKKEWYARNGIVEHTQNADADKQLIITRDKADGGIDSFEIKQLIEQLLS